MRYVNALLDVMTVGLLCLSGASPRSVAWAKDNANPAQLKADETIAIQNDRLGLVFDRKTGTLRVIENKLAGETYRVEGDEFEVEALRFHATSADARLAGLAVEGDTLTADYQTSELTIRVRYTLRGHFVEKQMTLVSPRDYGLKKLILGKPRFTGADLKMAAYRYSKFARKPGEEPNCTFFGRTDKGGLFAGVEVPFDASSLHGAEVILAYSPSLKIKATEELKSERAYFGVYRKRPGEQSYQDRPRQSESDAMVAMTSAIVGPPRFGLVPMACGWPVNRYVCVSSCPRVRCTDFELQKATLYSFTANDSSNRLGMRRDVGRFLD